MAAYKVEVAQEDRSVQLAGTGMVLVSAFAFSWLPIFNRYAQEAGVGVIALLAIRFVLAAACVWALLLARRGMTLVPERRKIGGLALMGLLYVIQALCFFFAARMLPVVTISLLLYLYPVFVMLLARVWFGERISRVRAGALVLALLGSLLVIGDPGAVTSVLGLGLGVGSALGYAIYIVVGSRIQVGVPAQLASAYIMSTAGILLTVGGAIGGQLAVPLTVDALAPSVGLALLCTVVPFLTFLGGMRRIGPSRAAILSCVEPLGTAVLGVLLLGEQLTAGLLLGGALVLGSVLLLARERA